VRIACGTPAGRACGTPAERRRNAGGSAICGAASSGTRKNQNQQRRGCNTVSNTAQPTNINTHMELFNKTKQKRNKRPPDQSAAKRHRRPGGLTTPPCPLDTARSHARVTSPLAPTAGVHTHGGGRTFPTRLGSLRTTAKQCANAAVVDKLNALEIEPATTERVSGVVARAGTGVVIIGTGHDSGHDPRRMRAQ